MANIQEYLNKIKNAIFGKDVRSSIHDGIDAINNEVISNTTLTNNTKVRQDLLENKYDEQIKNISASEPQSPEIVDARSGFDTLGNTISKKTYFFNNVAEMKACNKLKNGDCVQTLGYYSANDGGGAVYQIVNDTSLVDDGGSVHDITNGLKAKLVSNLRINYRMFGAKLNGTYDDTLHVINCHKYANIFNLMIIQNEGTLYMPTATITNCPIINSSCDFTGLTFKFDNNNDNNTVMIVADESTLTNERDDIQSIDLASSQINSLNGNTTLGISFLENYKNHHVCFDTNMSFGKRNDSNDDSIIYYKQSFIVNEYAQLSPNNMYANIKTNATTVKMRYLPLNQKYIEIKFGKILINGNTNNNPRFLIMRNNVTLSNAIIEKRNYNNFSSYRQTLFDVRYSANVEIKDLTGNVPVSEDTGVDTTTYVIVFDECYNVSFINNKLLKGHGAIASYYVTNFNFKNNYINRFDNHYGAYGNFIIKDNEFVGYPCRINLGFGNANVTIDACNLYKYQENNKPWLDVLILCRSDLGVMFSGTLNISNCKIEGKRDINNNEYVTVFQYITAHSNDTIYPEWANYNMPKINIDNIHWFVNNLNFRICRIINNNDHNYNLQNLRFNLSQHGNQARSQLYLDRITPGSAKIDLVNTDAHIYTSSNSMNINLYKNSLLYSTPNNTNVNVYENATINGNFATVENNGILTTQDDTVISNLYNYNKCVCNNTTINNLRSSGFLSGSCVSTPNGYISGILKPNKLINTGNIYIIGCYIELSELNNTDHVITLSGCSMYSSQATKFENNGTVVGNGNYAGLNSSIINTL